MTDLHNFVMRRKMYLYDIMIVLKEEFVHKTGHCTYKPTEVTRPTIIIMTNELPMNSSCGGVSERYTAAAFEAPQGEKKVEQFK